MRTLGTVLVIFSVLAAPAAAERTGTATSRDGTPIGWSFFPAGEGVRAPTVLYGTGYASGRPRCVGDTRCGILTTLRQAGYNILTWDPRGFGDSGGLATVDGPDTDGRDVQALLDVIARQPEAQLDGPADPRVGMTGESYGGGIQLVAAALDERIDAIVPELIWHNLPEALYPEETLKSSWMTLFAVAGEVFGQADGLDAGIVGGQDPHILRFWSVGLATGRPLDDDVAWLRSRGPAHLLDAVRAPTLLLQSTADTLFPLSHAVRVADRLRANGTPVTMVWGCFGGHGGCPGEPGAPGRLDALRLAWLDRWLRERDADTGAPFQWLADDGIWRAAPDFPLASSAVLTGTGSGSLTLIAGDPGAQGAPITPEPGIAEPVSDPRAVRVPLSAPSNPALVAAAPRLTLTYSGLAVPATTRVYAQLVDVATARVVGRQVRPIAVTLDGRTRTIVRDLELVALHASPTSRLRLELVPATGIFLPQRSTGTMRLSARVELPSAAQRP